MKEMGMSAPDHQADAWETYAKLMREIPSLGQHLQSGVTNPEALHQAARCAKIVAALGAEVATHAQRAAADATAPVTALDGSPVDDRELEVRLVAEFIRHARTHKRPCGQRSVAARFNLPRKRAAELIAAAEALLREVS